MIDADWWVVEAPLSVPFTTARGTTTSVELPIVEIVAEDGTVGYGAAGPSRYYGETAETVAAVLPDLLGVLDDVSDPFDIAAIHRDLEGVIQGHAAAKAAIDIALYDLVAKRLGVPVASVLGHGTAVGIESSYTIGIDDPSTMAERTRAVVEAGSSVLKVKLGGEDDEAAIRAVRDAAPAANIRVDANEAWTPSEAIRKIDCCAEAAVEFVEQPVPASNSEGLRRVSKQSSLPIAVDESCVVASDVPDVADRCDIVNLKLMKCGGISPALAFIHAARAHGKEVMVGCMVESAASIAAAAHLAPLVDYVDLDGALLLDEDPFAGSPVEPGRITLAADRPGLGIERDS